MTIPFRVKKLTKTAKLPERANEGDLWDLFADDFDFVDDIHTVDDKYDDRGELYASFSESNYAHQEFSNSPYLSLSPQGRILVKTGIAIELPICIDTRIIDKNESELFTGWTFKSYKPYNHELISYAVADLRPRSGLALKHGITVLNTPGTIDNSYRKEIGVILYNAGHEPYTINKGDKICQMLIRPLYPSSMEVVEEIEDTGRGAYGSTDIKEGSLKMFSKKQTDFVKKYFNNIEILHGKRRSSHDKYKDLVFQAPVRDRIVKFAVAYVRCDSNDGTTPCFFDFESKEFRSEETHYLDGNPYGGPSITPEEVINLGYERSIKEG